MPPFAPEIDNIILPHLSTKSLLHASTVCKAWHSTVMRLLYKSVDLCSVIQLERFMEGLMANDTRMNDRQLKNGYLVRDIVLHTSNIMMDNTEIDTLKRLCPLLTSFDYADHVFTLTDEHLCYFMPGWKMLKRLPAWHEDDSRLWIPQLGGQLSEIGCYMSELAVLPSLIESTSLLFPNLIDLKINMHFVGPPLTIAWMEMIDSQCPVLETLCVEVRQYDVGDVDQNSKKDWSPAEKLQTLKWDTDRYFDPLWYTYLAQKYSNITRLELTLGNDGEFPVASDETVINAHKISILDMVTSFQQLTSLSITTDSHEYDLTDWYPWNEFATWLGTDEAKRIEDLRWRTEPQLLRYIPLGKPLYEFNTGNFDQDINMDEIRNLNPLGNIKALKQLAFDVPSHLPEQISNLSFGALTLESVTNLELFFSSDYSDLRKWQEVDMNTLLDACPNITFLGLAGVFFLGEFTDHPPRTRLHSLRLLHVQFFNDDYMTRLINRCPNLDSLELHSCFIKRHPSQEQSHVSGQMTINAPNHAFTLVDVRVVSFDESKRLNLLSVKQSSQKGSVAVDYRLDKCVDQDAYAMYFNCRQADTVIFI